MCDPIQGQVFDPAFRKQVEQLLRWHRGVRRFRSDPVDPDLERKSQETPTTPSATLLER